MADKKLCFVIGPIGDADSDPRIHADWLLEGIIEPVMAEHADFIVKRADQDPRPGLIDAQLINDLLNADLVVADLSFFNPNVYYEIGIRHMAQKPIIHMQLSTEKPPFDLSLYRAIKFSRVKYRDIGVARLELKRAVDAVLAKDYQIENPVTHARGRLQLNQHATSEQRVLIDQLDAFGERLEMLEDQLRFLTPLEVTRNRTLRALSSSRPLIFTRGGELAPAATMVTFSKKEGLNNELSTKIINTITKSYGTPTQIARNLNNLILLIPAHVDVAELAVPFAAEGMDISLTQRPA